MLAQVRSYADGRESDVLRGAETPELAATLLDKFGWGMSGPLRSSVSIPK
jgi:hypothetical protein